MEKIKGGVTAAKGFEAAGAEAAIKYQNRKDMAMVYSKVPCKAAGTFTTNVVKAAPVLWDRDIVTNSEYAQAVVVNAGIANACTGKQGLDYCRREAEVTGRLLGIPAEAVLVGSTGVIGMQLPMDRIEAGIAKLVEAKSDTLEAGHTAACSIMTTDTISKEIAVSFELDGKEITVGGMSKGSGMIHPNMCTMLSFVTTDAAISKELLQEALSQDIQDTYNMISVDGDTSTNDTVLLLANGLAGNKEITEKNEDYHTFCRALKIVNETLAKHLLEEEIPHIIIGHPDFETRLCWIDTDHTLAGEYAADHICECGYTNVFFIAGRRNDAISNQRLKGFKKGMIHHKEYITRENIGYTNNTQEGAYEVTRTMLQKLPKPQAIVCENNLLALGVVNALRDLSFSIPDDIGLLTFDIYPYSKIITPQPTVIDINMYDIGIQAGRMMLHKLENPRLMVQSFTALPTLIQGQTTTRII